MFASGYQADLDVNMDGAVDSKDSGVVSKLRGRSLGAGELSDRGNIVGWCGYLYEEATGMWLARHRWQIPELGRWANRDPIGYAGGGQNLYEYVNGNPVFLQDSMGLSDENPDYDNIAHLRAYEDEETGQRMQASPCWSSLRGILEDQRDGESMEDCAKRVEGSKANFKRWECQKELAEDAPGIPWNDLLTDPHVVLGVLGMTPGFGIAADLVDAGLYLSEGKFAEAGWSLVAAVPFVGDAIAAGRLGSRVSKVVKATGNAVNRAMPPQFTYLTSTAGPSVNKVAGKVSTALRTQPRNALGQFMPWKGLLYRLSGARAVDDFVDAARGGGYVLIATEVTFRTPFGLRRVDVVMRNPRTNNLHGFEVKSSRRAFRRYNFQQSAADRWINRMGGANAIGSYSSMRIQDIVKIRW